MTKQQFIDCAIRAGLVPSAAVDDAENYDSGATLYQLSVMWTEMRELKPDEPNGDEWRSPVTAPKDQDCLFSLRPITKDDPYFVDTSGNPILGKSEPRVIVSRYGRWSSLEVMMGWMPLPQPLNREGDR